MKMNKERKELLVAALLSGDYKQGKKALRPRADNFCCLGVACNLHALAHPKIAAEQTDTKTYMGETEGLPIAVAKWLGFKNKGDLFQLGPFVMIDGHLGDLAAHNDHGKSFKQIAQAIQEQL